MGSRGLQVYTNLQDESYPCRKSHPSKPRCPNRVSPGDILGDPIREAVPRMRYAV